MKVSVVTDSTSDLPPEVARDLGITVVPAHIQFGEQVFLDGVELTTDEFYRRLQSSSKLGVLDIVQSSPPLPAGARKCEATVR